MHTPSGIMEITEEHNERYYNGLPSVTTVLAVVRQPWLEQWRGKVGNEQANRISKEAAWIGTLFHDTITCWESTGEHEPLNTSLLDPEIATLVTQYLSWRTTTLNKWTHYEEPIVSKELGFGGTPDRVGVLKYDPDHHLSLVDFKTGSPSPLHPIQTAGYKLLLEYKGIHISRRLSLYIPSIMSSTKQVIAREHTHHRRDLDAFTNCLQLYYYMQFAKAHQEVNSE